MQGLLLNNNINQVSNRIYVELLEMYSISKKFLWEDLFPNCPFYCAPIRIKSELFFFRQVT